MRRAFLFLTLAACTHDVSVFDQIESVPASRDVDVLYVLDNSAGRASFDVMASQVADLRTTLSAVDGQLPSLHVGVVTTDLGTTGTMDPDGSNPTVGFCSGAGDGGRLQTFFQPITGSFLVDERAPDGTRIQNFEGDLETQLAALTNPPPGKTGCEFIQPFAAMQRALDPTLNPNFIRPGAQLEVIFLTNKDDCSFTDASITTGDHVGNCVKEGVLCEGGVCEPREDSARVASVADYRDFLLAYKPDHRDVSVSAVIGPSGPLRQFESGIVADACTGAGTTAKPNVRIRSLVDSMGGTVVDICSQVDAYKAIAAPLTARQHACFPALTAEDGDDCRVIQRVNTTETELAPCGAGGATDTPCWKKFTDEALCPGGGNVGISIDRGTSVVPAGAQISATCFLE